jgi:putative sigma-54 modulation protein
VVHFVATQYIKSWQEKTGFLKGCVVAKWGRAVHSGVVGDALGFDARGEQTTPLVIPGGSMNLTISGHHLDVTPALRSYVTHKLDRITRHFDRVVDVKVLLTVEKQKEKQGRQRAECNIHVKGNDLFAESAHADLYAAVDDLVDKLDRQVVRHKDKLQDHQHTTAKRALAA